MTDFALLLLRIVTGGLIAGHGAQKLFGAFGGHGLGGTTALLEKIGIRPAHVWAPVAAAAEFGGGSLTAAGLLSPVGPVGVISAMAVATGRAHWGKPIWVTSGGAELPVTNAAVMTALSLAGPGRWSLDRALGVRLPWPVRLGLVAGAAGGVAFALGVRPPARRPADAGTAGEPEGEVAGRQAQATTAG
jgi:putative oxidoreductase